MSTEFKLDRTAFKAQSFEEADDNVELWRSRSVEDRLNAAAHLSALVYGVDIHTIKMDRTIYSERTFEQ